MSQQDTQSGLPLLHIQGTSYSNAHDGLGKLPGHVKVDPVKSSTHPLERLTRLFSTIVQLLFPIALTAYFICIWRFFLARDSDNPVKYGIPYEIWIFYSWFLIGVFGLGWSKFSLIGAENAVQASSKAVIAAPNERSWSSLGGWIKALNRGIFHNESPYHSLWYFLTAVSILMYVALPLSGLCLELSDGYVPLSTSPNVLGHKWDTFNERQSVWYDTGVEKGWQIGSPATVPGFGLIYTPPYIQRGEYSTLENVPNSLAWESGIPEMFLAPQAMTPVSGDAWGVRASYNCSILEDISEFTILNQTRSSVLRIGSRGDYETPSGDEIYLFNSDASSGTYAYNLWADIEMGVSMIGDQYGPPSYNGSEPRSFDPDGAKKAEVLELLIWQAQTSGSYDTEAAFNRSVEPTVQGLGHPIMKASNGSFIRNETFYKVQVSNRGNISTEVADYKEKYSIPYDRILSTAKPIGIQCRVMSTLGTARLNPRTSTFDSFKELSNPPIITAESPMPRLGFLTQETLQGSYFELFRAANAPPPLTVSNSYMYQNFVQPQVLKKSVMLLYALEGLQLMYDGVYGFEGTWDHPNLTSSSPGKILTAGVIPPIGPVVLFVVWAISCTMLRVNFGCTA
ncbi:hypothetical protein AUP68_09863 [Ilyonectria robusta]